MTPDHTTPVEPLTRGCSNHASRLLIKIGCELTGDTRERRRAKRCAPNPMIGRTAIQTDIIRLNLPGVSALILDALDRQ